MPARDAAPRYHERDARAYDDERWRDDEPPPHAFLGAGRSRRGQHMEMVDTSSGKRHPRFCTSTSGPSVVNQDAHSAAEIVPTLPPEKDLKISTAVDPTWKPLLAAKPTRRRAGLIYVQIGAAWPPWTPWWLWPQCIRVGVGLVLVLVLMLALAMALVSVLVFLWVVVLVLGVFGGFCFVEVALIITSRQYAYVRSMPGYQKL